MHLIKTKIEIQKRNKFCFTSILGLVSICLFIILTQSKRIKQNKRRKKKKKKFVFTFRAQLLISSFQRLLNSSFKCFYASFSLINKSSNAANNYRDLFHLCLFCFNAQMFFFYSHHTWNKNLLISMSDSII